MRSSNPPCETANAPPCGCEHSRMREVLLDTDVLSEILKGKNSAVMATATRYREEHKRYTTSVITVMEMVKGLQKAGREDALARLIEALDLSEVLPFDRESAIIAGRICGDLERLGKPIGRADPMIAGIAIRHESLVVTGNQEHYARIQSAGYPLHLDTWR